MSNAPGFFKDFLASLKSVVYSGSYNDLTNKPTLGTAAALNVGNSASQILQKTSDNKYPVGDGSNLTNIIVSDITPSIPYSVISAVVDANGRANFMSSALTQLNFNVTVPIKIRYPIGTVEINATMTSISTGLANGINYITKEFGGNPYFTLLQPVEQFEAPASPAAGQLWLDLSVSPYVPKKWNGSAWVTTQYVKLGEVVISALVIGTPTNYMLNGVYVGKITNAALATTYTINANIGSSFSITGKVIADSSTGDGYSLNVVSCDSGLSANGRGTLANANTKNVAKIITAQSSWQHVLGNGYTFPGAVNSPYIEYVAKRNF